MQHQKKFRKLLFRRMMKTKHTPTHTKTQTDKRIKLNHWVGQPLASRFRLVFLGEVFGIFHQLSACASLELTAALGPASEKIDMQANDDTANSAKLMAGLEQTYDTCGTMLFFLCSTLNFASYPQKCSRE